MRAVIIQWNRPECIALGAKETFTSCPSSKREQTDIFMSEVTSSPSKEVTPTVEFILNLKKEGWKQLNREHFAHCVQLNNKLTNASL